MRRAPAISTRRTAVPKGGTLACLSVLRAAGAVGGDVPGRRSTRAKGRLAPGAAERCRRATVTTRRTTVPKGRPLARLAVLAAGSVDGDVACRLVA